MVPADTTISRWTRALEKTEVAVATLKWFGAVRMSGARIRKVLKRFLATLVAMCVGLLLFLVGLESVEYRGVVPSIPDWFVAVMFLPTLVTESTGGSVALLRVLYALQFALVGYLVDWLRAACQRPKRTL